LHEIRHLREGTLKPEELDKARRALRLESLETFQSLNRLLDQAAERIEWGLAFQTVADDLAAQRGATVAELNELAGQTLPLDQAVLVLVGDKKIILEQIKDLGLTAPIELHARGEPATQPAS
jgi:predicted Zn-dependent peptidase